MIAAQVCIYLQVKYNDLHIIAHQLQQQRECLRALLQQAEAVHREYAETARIRQGVDARQIDHLKAHVAKLDWAGCIT